MNLVDLVGRLSLVFAALVEVYNHNHNRNHQCNMALLGVWSYENRKEMSNHRHNSHRRNSLLEVVYQVRYTGTAVADVNRSTLDILQVKFDKSYKNGKIEGTLKTAIKMFIT